MLIFKLIRALCKCFSGGMNKTYEAETDKILQKFNIHTTPLSQSQEIEIKKHANIFSRSQSRSAGTVYQKKGLWS
jgi:hypothetical protein